MWIDVQGYLDPEYFSTREFSPKSDVYSFGVILLELLTGKAPIQHGNYVVREIKTAVDKMGTEGIWEMLDPILIDAPVQDLEPFLKLALTCVEETGAQRPAMSEVVKQLEGMVGDSPHIEKSNSLAKKLQPTTPKHLLGNTEPSSTKSARSWKSGQSSSSQNSSFKYSGVFTPGPVNPKWLFLFPPRPKIFAQFAVCCAKQTENHNTRKLEFFLLPQELGAELCYMADDIRRCNRPRLFRFANIWVGIVVHRYTRGIRKFSSVVCKKNSFVDLWACALSLKSCNFPYPDVIYVSVQSSNLANDIFSSSQKSYVVQIGCPSPILLSSIDCLRFTVSNCVLHRPIFL